MVLYSHDTNKRRGSLGTWSPRLVQAGGRADQGRPGAAAGRPHGVRARAARHGSQGAAGYYPQCGVVTPGARTRTRACYGHRARPRRALRAARHRADRREARHPRHRAHRGGPRAAAGQHTAHAQARHHSPPTNSTLQIALTKSRPELLATALQEAEAAILAVALTQVSCDWLAAGHVTTILASDWSCAEHAGAADRGAAGRHAGQPEGRPHLRLDQRHQLVMVVVVSSQNK